MMKERVKSVTFDWKEMFKTDMEVVYRVTCKITLDSDKTFEASEIINIHKLFTNTHRYNVMNIMMILFSINQHQVSTACALSSAYPPALH